MTTEELKRGMEMLEMLREINATKEGLRFVRANNRPLWVHSGEARVELIKIPPELWVAVLDLLDNYVERETKRIEEDLAVL